MDESTLLTIARQGTKIGQFPLSAVRVGILSGKFTTKDFYWTSGMTNWAPIEELPAEKPAEPAISESIETQAEEPSSTTSAAAVPITPSPNPSVVVQMPTSSQYLTSPPPPAAPSDWRKTARTILLTIGGLEFFYGLTTSPDGSAIRQQVLVQHMTNGLLFAILALMVRKLD